VSWTRLDDNWTRKIRALGLSFQTRWHYIELIQFVSATGIAETPVRAVDARTCSDVDDPAACLDELESKGLVTRDRSGDYTLPRIGEHIPPPHMRDEKRKADQSARKQRERAHKAGDHSLCLPDRPCRQAVTSDVTRDIGTGQDWTGQVTNRSNPALEAEEDRTMVVDVTGWAVEDPPMIPGDWPSVRTPGEGPWSR
jgi:hypothetical protein